MISSRPPVPKPDSNTKENSWLHGLLRPYHPWLLGAAWIFIGASIIQVTVATLASGPSTALGKADFYQPVGLTYVGPLGTLLGFAQLALITAAAMATIYPAIRWRRIGNVILLAWAVLWTVNMYGLAGHTESLHELARAAMMTLMLGCTGYRAVHGWTPDALGTPAPRLLNARSAMHDSSSIFRRDAHVADEDERFSRRHIKLNSDRVVDRTPMSWTRAAICHARTVATGLWTCIQSAASSSTRMIAPTLRFASQSAGRIPRTIVSKLRQWAVLPQRPDSRESSAV